MEARRRYTSGGTMKVAIAVADAPIRLSTTLKLGTESPMNNAINTMTVLTTTLFHVNSKEIRNVK